LRRQHTPSQPRIEIVLYQDLDRWDAAAGDGRHVSPRILHLASKHAGPASPMSLLATAGLHALNRPGGGM